jgi:hypothetical protein
MQFSSATICFHSETLLFHCDSGINEYVGCRVYVETITYCADVYIFIAVVRYTQMNLNNWSWLEDNTILLLVIITHTHTHSTSPLYITNTNTSVNVKVTLRLTVCQSASLGIETHLRLMNVYLLLFDRYGLVFVGRLSLTRGRVCLLYMLLVLASVVFLGSESLWTRDHNLLSQIWDFPFHRLLRLAGSWWRYSTPPPHGC